MQTFRLGSEPMINTPGLINWIVKAVAPFDDEQAATLINAAFPTLPDAAITAIMEKAYIVEGDVVIVTVEG